MWSQALAKVIPVEAELRADNKNLRAVDLQVFSDALKAYCEASANIRENGTIVMHPRTGSPIENPYLRIQKQAGDVITRMRLVKADRVLGLLQKQIAAAKVAASKGTPCPN